MSSINSKPLFNFQGLNAIENLSERWNGLSMISNVDGKYDFFAATVSGKVYHFEQTSNFVWSATLINEVSECQSCKHYDIDGDGKLEVFTVEKTTTTNGEIRIHKPTDGITGSYTDTVLATDRDYPQDMLIYDIDGDGEMEIIYSYQGTASGQGGLRYLDWDGVGDVMNLASWTEYNMTTHESAWWIGGFHDFKGEGNNCLLFSSRNNRNPASIPGIYYIYPDGAVTNPWNKVAIDDEDTGFLHVTTGNFFGNKHSKDVAAISLSDGVVRFYDFNNSFQKSTFESSATAICYNLKSLGGLFTSRDTLLLINESDKAYVLDYIGGSWTKRNLWDTNEHPADNEIIFIDLAGTGKKQVIIDDSELPTGHLYYFNII